MRTEEQILKDFEKLGYIVEESNIERLQLWIPTNGDTIAFLKKYKEYVKFPSVGEEERAFTKKEHELIHELITIWGWLK